VVAYCLVTAVFAEELLEFVYGPEYGQYARVVELFAIYYLALSFSTVTVAVLSARGMTRPIFAGMAAGAALSLATSWFLLGAWGPAGGVVGMLASWAASMAVFLRATRLRAGGTSVR
jgi:O-antigen/teichoic acid export membrane protein